MQMTFRISGSAILIVRTRTLPEMGIGPIQSPSLVRKDNPALPCTSGLPSMKLAPSAGSRAVRSFDGLGLA